MLSTAFTIIDDTEMTYNDDHWSTGGSFDEYNITTHGTTIVGAQAVYTFNGSRIEVFGTIGCENDGDPTFAATSSYTIDNIFDSTVQFTGVVGSVKLYKQLFYTSDTLDEGQHTLTISYTTAGKNPLWLDYLRVTRTLSKNTMTTTTTTTTPTSIAAATSASPPARPTTFPTTSVTSSILSSPGAISGIVGGSCAALILLVIIFLLTRSLIREPQESVEAPSPDGHHQNSASWFKKLFAPAPPPEIHPFDPYATMTMTQISRNTKPTLTHQAYHVIAKS